MPPVTPPVTMLSRAARPALRAGTTPAARCAITGRWPRDVLLTARLSPATCSANYATLREIEGRLKSIRNIEKITKTMKIVASTKLTRAQRAMTNSRTYGETSNTVFEQAETKPLEAEGLKKLIVVASSDKGLCGGIHSGLSKKVRAMLLEDGNADIVVVGEKSKAQLARSNGKAIVLSFGNIGKDVPTFADAQAIADQISMLPTQYSSIQIIYNKFIKRDELRADADRGVLGGGHCKLPYVDSSLGGAAADSVQPTLPPLRLMTRCWPTCASTRWPTRCTGYFKRCREDEAVLICSSGPRRRPRVRAICAAQRHGRT